MAIFRNIIVSVPEEAYVEKDATVFVKDKNKYDPQTKYNRVKHTVIGRFIGDGRMYPNHTFRIRYPAIFEEASGEKLPRQTKKIGFYTAVLSIVERTGLYDALIKSYGIENANMAVDFSTYSIIHHSCVAEQYPCAMEDQLLFSSSLWNQSRISRFFNNEISEERTSVFRKIWAGKCRERDLSEAWIAIDGTNNDCEAREAGIAESGKAKSQKNVSIVSYMYAVDSRNGDPITFSIYRGGRVDCKAVIEMVGWLTAFDVKVKGVIVDRGFATKEVLELFDQNGINYVAMLKGDAKVHTAMLDRYADKIRMQYKYMLGKYNAGGCADASTEYATDSDVLYGVSEAGKERLFSAHDYEAYVSLIYDGANGGKRQETWFKKVSNAALRIQRQLDMGKNAGVAKEYAGYINIIEMDGRDVALVYEDKVQEWGCRKGFFTLASSEALDAMEANRLYALRNSSEEQFSVVKSQLGYDTTGVHYANGIKAKLALAFISAVIRNELVKASRESALSTNRMVNELDQLCMHLDGNDQYFVCHTENQRQIAFMKACGVLPKDMDRIAEAENIRLASPEPNPHHRYPKNPEGDPSPRKGPGRPKGTENRAKKAATEGLSGDRKKPGRPPGSKNKKTLGESLETEALAKRKPGRPKGSRNKPKSDTEAPKRNRGRPRKEDR